MLVANALVLTSACLYLIISMIAVISLETFVTAYIPLDIPLQTALSPLSSIIGTHIHLHFSYSGTFKCLIVKMMLSENYQVSER